MNWSSLISGSLSIAIGLFIFLSDYEKPNYDFGSIFWSLFFIIIGSFIIMNSEDADKIEGIRRKK